MQFLIVCTIACHAFAIVTGQLNSYVVYSSTQPAAKTKKIVVAFQSCTTTPLSIYGNFTVDSNYSFHFATTSIQRWGFKANITRLDSRLDSPPSVVLNWISIFPTTTPLPTTAPTTITVAQPTEASTFTSGPQSTLATTKPSTTGVSTRAVTSAGTTAVQSTTAPQVFPPCITTTLYDRRVNRTFTFSTTPLGQTANSWENCSATGIPAASSACVANPADVSKSVFDTPFLLNCNTTLTTVLSQINVNTATNQTVKKDIASIKILSSRPATLTPADVVNITQGLVSLGRTNPNTITISVPTLYDVLATADYLSQTFNKTTRTTVTQNTVQTTRSIVSTLNTFVNRVSLPNQTTSITLTTATTTLFISDPVKNATTTYNPVRFTLTTKLNSTSYSPFSAFIPAAVIAEAAKNRSTTPRASFVYHATTALFPAKQQPAFVLTVGVRGYNPVKSNAPISIVYSNITAEQGSTPFNNGTLKSTVTRTQCNVYQTNDGRWVPNGCSLVLGSSPPKCDCYKLASFSMIVSSRVFPSAFYLGIVSYVGMGLSIIGLLLTIAVHLAVRELRKKQPTVFLLNICFNLLVADIIFMAGIGYVEDNAGCYVFTAFLQFFFLTTWLWMSANAYNLYKALSKLAFIGQSSIYVPGALAYLVPILIVTVNAGVTIIYWDLPRYNADDPFFVSTYRAFNLCWVHQDSLYYGFLLPVGIMCLFNLVMFVLVIWRISCGKRKIQSTQRDRSPVDDLVVAIAIFLMMGLTWVFGFLMLVADQINYQEAMAWLFTIFNSTQGLLIFLLNCVRQERVRKLWCGKCATLCASKQKPAATSMEMETSRLASKTPNKA